jgi:signal transduction histidine kinase
LTSLFSGTGPGLLAAGISALAFRLFYFSPESAQSDSPASLFRFGLFLAAALATVELIELRRRNQSELAHAKERMAQAMKIATAAELAGAIAHETSQPLHAIVADAETCLYWLTVEPANLTDAKLAAERVRCNGKEAADVVRKIRRLFKKTTLETKWMSIDRVIGDVLRLVHDDLVSGRIIVETDLEKDLPPIRGDRDALRHAIFNIVHNAIEAMEVVNNRPKKLRIKSRLEQREGILLEIGDTGIGIGDAERAFEAFYTTKKDGLGMGLAICRSIVEAHGGRVGIEPNGAGSTVTLTLPVKGALSHVSG